MRHYPYLVQWAWTKSRRRWGTASRHLTEAAARSALKQHYRKHPLSDWRIIKRTPDEVVTSWPT